jgi:hypothetical protein
MRSPRHLECRQVAGSSLPDAQIMPCSPNNETACVACSVLMLNCSCKYCGRTVQVDTGAQLQCCHQCSYVCVCVFTRSLPVPSIMWAVVCAWPQVASQSNTPLVSQAVVSPMVARGLLADKAERDALLAAQGSRNPRAAGQAGEHAPARAGVLIYQALGV